MIYVGRIDANKGCAELFDYFGNYRPRLGQQLSLILAGTSILPIPAHPRIRHLGFISDRDKFDAIAASEALIMPSRFESLSMVALEAWGLGRPVLANGRCDVLRGQTIRSRAGLYYDDFPEFAEALFTLTSNRPLHQAFGENGRRFYERHYAWPVIQRKYRGHARAAVAGQRRAGRGRCAARLAGAPAADAGARAGNRRRHRQGPGGVRRAGGARGCAVARPVQQLRRVRRRVHRRSPAGRPSAAGRTAAAAGPRATVRIGPIARRAAAPASRARKLAAAARPAPAPREHRPRTGAGRRAQRDRQDGRRGQNRQGRQRRPPRRNG